MVSRLSADVLDPRFYDHLGEVPAELFDDRLYWSVELVERYAREWAVELAGRLDLPSHLDRSDRSDGGTTAPELLEVGGLDESLEPAVVWILEQLVAAGMLHAVGLPGRPEGRRYRPVAPGGAAWRAPHREEMRGAALEHHEGNEPFLDLVDAAGEALPRIAAGETTGEAALLGAAGIGRWSRYFSNDNPVYALNNRLTAVAVAERLPAGGTDREDGEGGARLLEVGAGAGSGSAALLELLERRGLLDRVHRYRVTEPAALLRRRSERTLPKRWPEAETGVELRFAALDIDHPWAEQGVEPGNVDLVFGVNVFHVADDLQASLGEAFRALAPGGWLIAGECLRPRPGQPVAAELPFLLLEEFRDVTLDAELRPHAGFLTPEVWLQNLERAGFEELTLVPDVRVLRDYYPRITTGVVCGRRPGT